MLKYQITLIAVLIGCIAFVACDRAQQVLEPVMPDPEPEMMDTGDMTGMMDMVMDAYKSWAHKVIDEDVSPAHDLGSRTVYFNEAAAMANMAGTAYPVGSMIVKVSMDTTNTFESQISTMTKTDSADNDGWVYGVSGHPVTAAQELMVNTLSAEMAVEFNCVGCHAKAPNDFVFVSLSKMEDDGMDDGGTDGMDDGGTDGMDDGGTDGMDDGGTDGMDDGGTDGNGTA